MSVCGNTEKRLSTTTYTRALMEMYMYIWCKHSMDVCSCHTFDRTHAVIIIHQDDVYRTKHRHTYAQTFILLQLVWNSEMGRQHTFSSRLACKFYQNRLSVF